MKVSTRSRRCCGTRGPSSSASLCHTGDLHHLFLPTTEHRLSKRKIPDGTLPRSSEFFLLGPNISSSGVAVMVLVMLQSFTHASFALCESSKTLALVRRLVLRSILGHSLLISNPWESYPNQLPLSLDLVVSMTYALFPARYSDIGI